MAVYKSSMFGVPPRSMTAACTALTATPRPLAAPSCGRRQLRVAAQHRGINSPPVRRPSLNDLFR